MLYFIIISSVIAFLLIIMLSNSYFKKKNNKTNSIEINFEDIDSLNVSKIVVEENDIDFIRNDFWYQYKQKKIINPVVFHRLKKNFEDKNNIKVATIKNEGLKTDYTTLELIEIIISDQASLIECCNAYYLLEKKLTAI